MNTTEDSDCSIDPFECPSVHSALIYAHDADPYLDAYHAFTLSPDPAKYWTNDPYDQYKTLLYCIFLKKSLMLKTFTKFLFVPELNANGNVHIHGYYSVLNPYLYYRWFLPACKQWGFVIVKPRVDDNWTYNYVTKTVGYMAEVMEELPVPLTEENIRYHASMKKLRPKYTMNQLKRKKRTILSYFKS